MMILSILFGILSFIGAAAFAMVNVPQILKCRRTRRTDMLSMLTIVLNLVGNVCCCSYLLYTDVITGVWHIPLYFNYGPALVFSIILFRMKRKFG